MTQHDTASDVKVSLPIELCNPKKPNPGTVTTTSTSDRHRLRAKLKSYLDKKSSVKRYNRLLNSLYMLIAFYHVGKRNETHPKARTGIDKQVVHQAQIRFSG